MTELGYLPLNLAPDSIERELLFDMWNLLKGEDSNGITVRNIKKMLLAVQGIHLPTGEHEYLSTMKKSMISSNQIDFDDEGNIRFT